MADLNSSVLTSDPSAPARATSPFAQAQGLTSGINAQTIQQNYPPPSPLEVAIHQGLMQQTASDMGIKYDDTTKQYHQELQDMAEKTPHGKMGKAISNIFQYGFGPAGAANALKQQKMQYDLHNDKINNDLKTLMLFPKASVNQNPEQTEALFNYADKMTKLKKEQMAAEAEVPLKAAQTAEALGAARFSNVHAEQYPKELQNKADETQVQAQKTYLDYDIANKKYQQDGTQQSYKEAQDARENFLKAVAANTEIKKLNNAEKVTATEQIKSDTGMVPRNPGYKAGVSKTINPMQFLTPPPRGVPVAGANTPQTDAVLQSLARKTGYPSIQGQAGHFATPPPAGPPPSLLTPQPQQGNPITPTQTAAAGIGVPTAPPGGAGPAGDASGNQNAEPAINPTDIPIPFSLQQMMKNVPILNRTKADIILHLYREYLSQKHPEGPVLAAATNALKKLQAPVIGAK